MRTGNLYFNQMEVKSEGNIQSAQANDRVCEWQEFQLEQGESICGVYGDSFDASNFNKFRRLGLIIAKTH